jgi:SAM-dependent methyltransferase
MIRRSTMTRFLVHSGVGRVICFNWPKYVGALITLTVLGIAQTLANGLLRLGLVVLLLGLTYGIFASLVATWWAYDYRACEVYQAIATGHRAGGSWLLVHAGLDESYGRLTEQIGEPAAIVDVGPPGTTSRSLKRAHALVGRTGVPISKVSDFKSASIDTVVVLFGIHELRDPQQAVALLTEMRRITRPSGSILIIEHLRDVPNFSVYGPAILHFGSASQWKKAILSSSLRLRSLHRVAGLISILATTHV